MPPIGSQPKGARGTVGHPYSALNLRLVLASFGLVACAVLAGLLVWRDYLAAGIVAAVFAAVALVDLVVIQRRRRQRRRTDPSDHSLFE
jgi:membrane protein implicated in regulation of membrane protease activity